jgi:hypothetical protein
MAQNSLVIEDDDRFAQVFEHVSPRPYQLINRLSCHTWITAGSAGFIRTWEELEIFPPRSGTSARSALDNEVLIGLRFGFRKIERRVGDRQEHDVGLALDRDFNPIKPIV